VLVAGYYRFVVVARARQNLPKKPPKLGKFERQAADLFMLIDTDSSGFIEMS